MLSGLFYKHGSFLVMREAGQAGRAEIETLSTWFISAEGFHLQRAREYFAPTPGATRLRSAFEQKPLSGFYGS